MIKLSPRLDTIASLVSNKRVIDVGCDHGLLSIYLAQNGHEVIASDVSKNALNSALKNISKYKVDIETIVTNGIDNIEIKDNTTVVIAGMGTSTILEILSNKNFELADEIIISSHNELEELRTKLSKYYTITEEKVVFDKKYYVVLKLVNGRSKMSKREAYIGFNKDSKYSKYLYDKNMEILSRIPKKYVLKRLNLKVKNKWLRELF